jgi:hypothetical protein
LTIEQTDAVLAATISSAISIELEVNQVHLSDPKPFLVVCAVWLNPPPPPIALACFGKIQRMMKRVY